MNNLWKEIRQQLGEFRSPMSEGLVEGRLARKLLADADALLDIVRVLEWYPWPGTSRRMCLLCQYDEKLGHAKSCKYAALDQPDEEQS